MTGTDLESQVPTRCSESPACLLPLRKHSMSDFL